MKILLILFTLLSVLNAESKPLPKVSLQLMWLEQFQFAGYYMAKEKGFYKDAGFNVEIKKYQHSVDVLDEVVSKRATFGIGRSNLIRSGSNTKNIVLISSVFQSSPLVLIATKKSNIKSVEDFVGKRVMLTEDAVQTASLHAMISAHDIDKDKILYKAHSFDINDLIDGKVDLYAGYISNEPFSLYKKNIEYKVFSPKDDGFDFYSDILFTSRETSENHPDMVKKFNDASLKGWKYAFENIGESVDLIYKKYNSQNKTKDALRFEAKELKKLAYSANTELGDINKVKIQRIYDIYKLMGLVNGSLDLNKLTFATKKKLLTKDEERYLRNKKEIRICVLPNSPPYSIVENGEYLGIGAEILKLTKRDIDIEYKLVETQSWMDSFKEGANKECDLLPITSQSISREHFFSFTTPYHYEPLVIVTLKDKNYILDFNTVINKTFSVVEGHVFIERLKNTYPDIKLTIVKSTHNGLEGVKSGKYYGHIDVLVGAAYDLKHHSGDTLQISGQFDDKVDVCFGVRKEDKVLFDIFEKLSKELKSSELQKILNDWVAINYTQAIEFEYKKELLLVVILIIAIFAYRQELLRKNNEKLKVLQDELVELNHALESKVVKANDDMHRAQEMANIGSWVLDLQKNDLRWSLQTYSIFEIDPYKHYDNLYAEFLYKVHPKDRARLESAYAKSLSNKESYNLEHRVIMDDGSVKYVLEHCETTFDEDGNALVSYGTAQDITEATLIKMEIKEKDLQLLHKSRLAQMGEMLSMIAHQWKQPLGSISAAQIAILMSIELEQYDLNDKKQREKFLEFTKEKLYKISKYVQNLSQIISDFSDFYRPNKKSEKIKLDDMIMKSSTLFKDSVMCDGIKLTLKLNGAYEVYIHENEFMQVILNIVNNAKEQLIDNKIIDAKIEVKTYAIEDDVFIEISDNGGGIKEDIIDKLFDPYFSTKLDKNGTGLGLYMSKIIIKDYHNGDIYAKNSQNGAIFTIKIKKFTEEI